jgi:hypothetical protein
MTLPTGTISMSQVNVELGLSATATISLNDAAVRNLAGVPSGAIGMNNLQGKSNAFAFTISSNQTDANLRSLAVAAGWNQSIVVVATIGSGVVISGSVQANSTAALTIDGSWPGGVTLVNNGTIAGRGGNGGNGARGGTSTAGSTGGRALLVSTGVTIQNNGTIAGGGGGGGGGGGAFAQRSTSNNDIFAFASGGGGGGGRTSNTASIGGTTPPFDGSNGANGSISAAGNGGAGGTGNNCGSLCAIAYGAAGGSGGDYGVSGGTGGTGTFFTSGAGSGSGTGYPGAAGGGAGQAVSGNSNITWTAFGTRLGAVV